MINYRCPHCQHEMEVPAKFAGERGTCTMCAIPFTVPPAEEANPASHAQTSSDIWSELHSSSRTQVATPTAPQPSSTPPGAYQFTEYEATEQTQPYPQQPASPGDPRSLPQGMSPGATQPQQPGGPAQPNTEKEVPDWVASYEGKLATKKVGPAFWAMAYFVPPVAIMWALVLPSGHSQKKLAIIFPCLWTIILVGLGFASQFAYTTFVAPEESVVVAAAATGSTESVGSEFPPPRPPRVDYMRLHVGKLYRSDKPISLQTGDTPSGGAGLPGIGLKLQPGGLFRVFETKDPIIARKFYRVAIVSFDSPDYLAWIRKRSFRGMKLEQMSEPSFMNPIPIPVTPDPVILEPIFKRLP